jgi:predicted DNA binding protein
MRYVELSIRPDDRWLQAVDSRIADHPDLCHGPIHNVNLLADDTAISLYEVEGDPAAVASVYEDDSESLHEEITRVDGVTYVFSHFEPSPVVEGLLRTVQEYRLALETPIEIVDGDQLQVSIVADAEAIQRAMATIPDAADVSVEKTGSFAPAAQRPYAELTERQQEVLRVALEMGYYEMPREATYDDIAAEVDCSATTVGNHLRKIEAAVLRDVTPSVG